MIYLNSSASCVGLSMKNMSQAAATDGLVQAYAKTKLDFTKPENFVRLFNLPIVNNGTRTVGYFVVYEFTMKTVEEFIECLIIKLQRTQLLVTGEVKQSIGEAEWMYE